MTGTTEFAGRFYANGRASDPRELGWMRGAPPDADKLITFESDRFLDFPEIRGSLSHMRELTATANMWRGPVSPSHLPNNVRSTEISTPPSFVDSTGQRRNFVDALNDTYTDDILVLHRDRTVYERYFGALEAHLPHAGHSITKSYARMLAGSFIHEGVLDDQSQSSTFCLNCERYKTVNTDVMTWVMERVTGRPFSRLLQDRIWAPLGCQEDGYIIVDAAGMAMTGAGLSAVVSEKNPRQVSGRNAALANRAGSDEADGPAESRQNICRRRTEYTRMRIDPVKQ